MLLQIIILIRILLTPEYMSFLLCSKRGQATPPLNLIFFIPYAYLRCICVIVYPAVIWYLGAALVTTGTTPRNGWVELEQHALLYNPVIAGYAF